MESFSSKFRNRARWFASLAILVLFVALTLVGFGALIIAGAVEQADTSIKSVTTADIESQERVLAIHKKRMELLQKRWNIGITPLSEFAASVKGYFDHQRSIYLSQLKLDVSNQIKTYNIGGAAMTGRYIQLMAKSFHEENAHFQDIRRRVGASYENGMSTQTDVELSQYLLELSAAGKAQYARYLKEVKLEALKVSDSSYLFVNEDNSQSDSVSSESTEVMAAGAVSSGTGHEFKLHNASDLPVATETDQFSLIVFYITRLSSVLLILLVISILIPIYRFLAKLSLFYIAKADAIDLIQATGSGSFEEVSVALMPTHEFESQSASASQVSGFFTEVIKAVGAKASK